MSRPDQPPSSAPDPLVTAGNQDVVTPQSVPLQLSHAEMNVAYRDGLATPFGQTVAWIMRHRDVWWVLYEGGWLRITDHLTAADLDRLAARMTSADAYAARDAAIRAAVNAPDPLAPPP